MKKLWMKSIPFLAFGLFVWFTYSHQIEAAIAWFLVTVYAAGDYPDEELTQANTKENQNE